MERATYVFLACSTLVALSLSAFVLRNSPTLTACLQRQSTSFFSFPHSHIHLAKRGRSPFRLHGGDSLEQTNGQTAGVKGNVAGKGNNIEGLYLSLKHRDSPESPFRLHHESRQDFWEAVVQRDDLRMHIFVGYIRKKSARGRSSNKEALTLQEEWFLWSRRAFGNFLKSPISGEYYTEFYIGTPPQHVVAMVDIGVSDFVWVPRSSCKECSHCAYGDCALKPRRISRPLNVTYECKCLAGGSIGTDTVNKLDGRKGYRPFASRKMAMMGFAQAVQSSTGGLLGFGAASWLESQLVQSVLVSGSKFSYCLADTDEPTGSSLIFGDHNSLRSPSKSGFQVTPLVKNPRVGTFYYVNLVAISVNDVMLPIPTNVWKLNPLGEGGTIVDPGTTFSKIAEPTFTLVVDAFKASSDLPRTSIPGFPLCYNISNTVDTPFPKFSLIFEKNAHMRMPIENYFVIANEQGDAMCLALLPAPVGSPSVIGNTQQQNFHMVFDRENSMLGFAPRHCASL